MLTNEEAFVQVANLDLPLEQRANGPRQMLVHFNSAGEVQGVYRYKWPPSEGEKRAVQAKHPDCVQMALTRGSCASEQELVKTIRRHLRKLSQAVPVKSPPSP